MARQALAAPVNPRKMALQDLPTELLFNILFYAVRNRVVKRALRLRLVSSRSHITSSDFLQLTYCCRTFLASDSTGRL
jgi:hypothetical protein